MAKSKVKYEGNTIRIQGARVNNLKNISVEIPHNQFVVITGLSGSGKSSLAFDTLYAEGQRRYVESLSSYARQFLGKMGKPEVDNIVGISPAIAIEQKNINRNPRSTVGTSTEIYEYLKLLFARIGRTFSPISGGEVKRDSVSNVTDFIIGLNADTKIYIYCPFLVKENRTVEEQLKVLQQMGFSRMGKKEKKQIEVIRIDDLLAQNTKQIKPEDFYILIDRLTVKKDDHDFETRVFDSVQTAYYEGNGYCTIQHDDQLTEFSNHFMLDGMKFEKPSENFFSFNNPYGACPTCEGFGNIVGISQDLVIPKPTLSVYEETVACWKGDRMSEWRAQVIKYAEKYKFPIHKPYLELTQAQKDMLWNGTKDFEGIYDFFKWVESKIQKVQYRVMLSRFRGKTTCPDCQGTRLRKDASYVKVGGKSIQELCLMPIEKLIVFFKELKLSESEQTVSKRLLDEINSRLTFLENVGLTYLTLNRLSGSLSGGESQRIRLATSLGSALVGSLYILDEPSIGLHSHDTNRLIQALHQLRDLGNTVIVVEHDEEIINASDYIIDIGPGAGRLGGEVVFEGQTKDLKNAKTLTADYVFGRKEIPVPKTRRKWRNFIEVKGACEHNLKSLDVKFPLDVLTVVTGLSGSGKTTLVKQTLYPALRKIFDGYGESHGKYSDLVGDIKLIQGVEMIDQDPIGRSSRSNPVTYVKAYDDIRNLYASQPLAKQRNYKAGYFSFNVEGGRCEYCQGEGQIKVEMQFMADVYLQCEECHGTRFKSEVLDVKYRDKNINDLLNMSIGDAIEFFEEDKTTSDIKRILTKLYPLREVGLEYLHMGQSSASLSGGEAQRVKLAYFLTKGVTDKPTVFIFDEPTTGLHFHDIHKLIHSINALIEKGHTVIVIEHHPDLIKCADHIIDIGPGGGEHGGNIVFEGTPENLIKEKKSITGKYLKNKL